MPLARDIPELREMQVNATLLILNHKATKIIDSRKVPGAGRQWVFMFPNGWAVSVVSDGRGTPEEPFETLIFRSKGESIGPNGWLALIDVQAQLDMVAGETE